MDLRAAHRSASIVMGSVTLRRSTTSFSRTPIEGSIFLLLDEKLTEIGRALA